MYMQSTCENCGSEFFREDTQTLSGFMRQRFCREPECVAERRKANREIRRQPPCTHCGGAGFISVSKDPDEIADCVCADAKERR